MKTNQAGVDLIKSFEGLRLEAYQDSVGVWTIGYGTTQGVVKGQKINQAQADMLLMGHIKSVENQVNACVTQPLTENQFAALVSFTYNLGIGSLMKSTLLKKVNAKDFSGAALEFLKWNKAGGVVLKGLVKRREAEKALFCS